MANTEGLSKRMNKSVASMLPHIAATIAERTSKAQLAIDLATAENWLLRPELLEICKDAFLKKLTASQLSYPRGFGGDPSALEALASFFNTYFYPHVPVQPDHIVITPGASTCLDTLLYNICDDGDSVLVPAPYWSGFDHHFHFRSSVVILPVFPLCSQATSSSQSLIESMTDSIISALTHVYSSHQDHSRIKALVITNPHNPLSLCYPHSVLRQCISWCHQRAIHFVSDEIYALSTISSLDGDINGGAASFVSALQIAGMKQGDVDGAVFPAGEVMEVDHSKIHVIWGMSKDFASSGIRMGCIVTQYSPALRTGMALLNSTTVSTFASLFAATLLTSRRLPALLALNSARLTSSFDILRSCLQRWDVEFIPPTAGLYVFARLGKDATTDEAEDRLVRRLKAVGVLVAGGKSFKMKGFGPGWVRITFSVPEEVLKEGLRRLERVLFDGVVVNGGTKRKICDAVE